MLAANVNLLVLIERHAWHLQKNLVERCRLALRQITDVREVIVYLLAPLGVRPFCARIRLALTGMVSACSDSMTMSIGFAAWSGKTTIRSASR